MGATILPKGTTINDRYVLDRKLGSDGDVYLAHDKYLRDAVAVKLLHPVGGQSQAWDEAQLLKNLGSRCLVPVLNADVVINSDIRFIVTPVMSGGDLENHARGIGVSVRTAIHYVGPIAAGISRIHAEGMVHRDIKPANALLSGSDVIVSDLQFCEIVDASGRASRNGSFCTLAPEAAPDSGFCSKLTDIYSLAATAFYLLSGEYPVDHRLPRAEQRELIACGKVRDLADVAPHVPQSVRAVVRKGLALDPKSRHGSVDEFAYAIANAMNGRRDWRRVEHPTHLHCVRGDAFNSRSAVVVCAVPADGGASIQARIDSAATRRVSGEQDQVITLSRLPISIRDVVKRLSAQ